MKFLRKVQAVAEDLTEDELSTICRWVESSSNDEVRASMQAMKGMLPEKFREVDSYVYRGAGITEDGLNNLRNGKKFKTNSAESWSTKQSVGEYFMHDTGYPYGIVFKYKPKLTDIIVSINAVHDWVDKNGADEFVCRDNYGESEVVLGAVVLGKENIVSTKPNKHYDGRKRMDNIKLVARTEPKWDEKRVEEILNSKGVITVGDLEELHKAIDYWEYINDISDSQFDDDVLQNVTKELLRIEHRMQESLKATKHRNLKLVGRFLRKTLTS